MKRKIYNKLLDWKQRWQGRTALLVDGARRIGKSWIVEEFGRNEYKSCVIIENFVAQQLRSYGHPLYFFSQYSAESENRMEIDFLISKEGITSRHNVIPIEVKSSTQYRLVSLDKFRNKFSSYLSTAVVFHPNDFEERDGVLFLPLYMAGL